MKKLFAVLVVLAVFVVGIGFYRGWFTLSSPSSPAGTNDVNVNLAADPDKMKEDAETVKDKAAELTGNATDDSAEPADTPDDEVQPKPTPPADGKPVAEKPKPEQSNGN